MEHMNSVPNHLAIIPDGNRRWAKKHGKSIQQTYDTGIRKIRDVAKWCKEVGIKTLTMWGLSTDNLKRDRFELSMLFRLFKKYLLDAKMYEEKEEEKKVKVRFFGRLYKLPKYIRDGIRYVENRTKNNGPYTLNLLLAYGGREEIVDAVNRLIKDGKTNVNVETFNRYLYGIGEPDLLIRTSGTIRTSGFMLWETAYTEMYFCRKLWPDFNKDDFIKAIKEYGKRQRKFGR